MVEDNTVMGSAMDPSPPHDSSPSPVPSVAGPATLHAHARAGQPLLLRRRCACSPPLPALPLPPFPQLTPLPLCPPSYLPPPLPHARTHADGGRVGASSQPAHARQVLPPISKETEQRQRGVARHPGQQHKQPSGSSCSCSYTTATRTLSPLYYMMALRHVRLPWVGLLAPPCCLRLPLPSAPLLLMLLSPSNCPLLHAGLDPSRGHIAPLHTTAHHPTTRHGADADAARAIAEKKQRQQGLDATTAGLGGSMGQLQ